MPVLAARPAAVLALMAFAGLALAGCSEPPAADAPSADGPSVSASATATPGPTAADPGALPGSGPGSGAGATLHRLAENLTYASELRRFALVADGPATVTLDLAATPDGVSRPSNCLAASAELRQSGVDEPVAGLYFVAWAGDAGLGTEAMILGQRVQLVPDPTPPGSTGVPGATVRGDAAFDLAAGDRVIVQVGGRFPQPSAGLQVDALVLGPAHLEELPPAPLACGRGLRDAEGSQAGLSTYIVTASVGGELAMQTATASTLLAAHINLGDASSLQYEFPGEEVQALPEELLRSSTTPGRIALLIERGVDEAGSLSWFMADAEWPLDPDDAED